MSTHYLSAVAIAKDEHPYIREWLHFHRIAGFERFYIYENSTDLLTAKVIQQDPELAPFCEIIHWPGKYAQLQCYEHFLAHYGKQTYWAAFFDCDEFLFRTDHGDLRQALPEYEHAPGIGVNWLMFGSNGHVKKPAGLVTQNYTRRAHEHRPLYMPQRVIASNPSGGEYWPFFSEVKSIVQPSRTEGVLSPHSFKYKNGEDAVDENFQPMPQSLLTARTARVSVGKLRVHHYWTKSIEELTQKVARGKADMASGYDMKETLLREHAMNEVVDETALAIAARIPTQEDQVAAKSSAALFEMPAGTVSSVHRRGHYYNFLWQNPKDTVQSVHKTGQFYELEELDLIERNLPGRNITAFDVGANVGNHAVYFSKVLNIKQVVVFEPNPPAIALLRANLLLNGCSNVETAYLGYGVGEAPASMSVFEPYENNLGAASLRVEASQSPGQVPVLPGDRFAIGYKSLKFLKIDVEGMELPVLRGFAWAIRRYRPDIFIEVLDGNAPAFHDWCAQNRYNIVETYRRYQHLQNYYLRAN